MRSLQPSNRPWRPQPFGFSPTPFPCSPLRRRTPPIHWASGVLLPVAYPADSGGLGRQLRWLQAWTPCLRSGLPISAPAPRLPGHPCPSVRHPRLLRLVRSQPSVSSEPVLRPATPAPVARALPASPHAGPAGLAPRAPQASRGSGPLAHLVSVFTLSSPVSRRIHAPIQKSDFQCPGPGLAPGLSASPPAPPSRWAAPARCWR